MQLSFASIDARGTGTSGELPAVGVSEAEAGIVSESQQEGPADSGPAQWSYERLQSC